MDKRGDPVRIKNRGTEHTAPDPTDNQIILPDKYNYIGSGLNIFCHAGISELGLVSGMLQGREEVQ